MLTTSYSSIQGFTSCPRSWYLRDLRRLSPATDRRSGPLWFGGRIHNALEAWCDGTTSSPVEAWHAICAHEFAIAAENEAPTDQLTKDATLGLVMLEGFMEWWPTRGEEQEYEQLAVEEEHHDILSLDVDDVPVDIRLNGKLDRLLRHRETGDVVVGDWKTTDKLAETAYNELAQSSQPRIYRALLAATRPDLPVTGIRYTMLRKVKRTAAAKPPFYFDLDLTLTAHDVEEHMRRVRTVVRQMLAVKHAVEEGVDHRDVATWNRSWKCTTCPFKNPCELWQSTGAAAAEAMLEDNYVERDPFERYESESEI